MTLVDQIVARLVVFTGEPESPAFSKEAARILAIVRAEVEPALEFAIRAHPDVHAGEGRYVKDTLRPLLERALTALRGEGG